MSDKILPIAGLGAAALLMQPELAGASLAGDTAAEGAAGGLLGSTGTDMAANAAAEGLGGGAFGSADMLAQNALGTGLAATDAASAAPLTKLEADGTTSTAFGPNGEYFGKSITDGTGMTANSYTGGYDSLNGAQRLGQRAQGLLDNSSLHMPSMQQQPQQARRPAMGGTMPKTPAQLNMAQAQQPTSLPYGNSTVPLQISPNDPRYQQLHMMGLV